MNCPKCGRKGLKITRASMDDLRAARVFWRCQSCHIWYDERGMYDEMPVFKDHCQKGGFTLTCEQDMTCSYCPKAGGKIVIYKDRIIITYNCPLFIAETIEPEGGFSLPAE